MSWTQETHFRPKYTHKLKVKGWTKIFHAHGKGTRGGVAILISEKIDFKPNIDNRRQRRSLYNDKSINSSKKTYQP